MANNLQYSVTVNNARLDAIESTAGTAVKLRLYSGSQPANCATAASGTLLLDIALPSDWMSNAAASSKAKTGTWSGAATGSGTAGYFRIYDSAGTNCHIQGTVGTTGCDMNVDNTSINSGQTVTVNTFTINAANQ